MDKDDVSLWVEKYAPRKYTELLSEEVKVCSIFSNNTNNDDNITKIIIVICIFKYLLII